MIKLADPIEIDGTTYTDVIEDCLTLVKGGVCLRGTLCTAEGEEGPVRELEPHQVHDQHHAEIATYLSCNGIPA